MKNSAFPNWFIEELANETDKEKATKNELKITDRVEFLCPIHGKYTQQIRVHIKKNTGERLCSCPKCSFRKRRKYDDWFIDMMASEEDKKRARENTLKSTEKIEFICPVHGVFKTRVDYITSKGKHSGVGCPLCGKEKQRASYSTTMDKKRKDYPKWFVDDLYTQEDKEKAIKRILKKTDKATFVCQKHGNYIQRVSDHLRYGKQQSHGCKLCANELMQEKAKEIWALKRESFPKWFINNIAFDEDKEKAKTKSLTYHDTIAFNCEKHGIYYQKISNHLRMFSKEPASGCPKCGARKSKQEDELFSFINSLEQNTIRRDRKTIKFDNAKRFLELDIFCPDKKIAFEYNGSYWHRENQHEKNYL